MWDRHGCTVCWNDSRVLGGIGAALHASQTNPLQIVVSLSLSADIGTCMSVMMFSAVLMERWTVFTCCTCISIAPGTLLHTMSGSSRHVESSQRD